ncbi:hypothetical protein AM1_4345 [Acaryochloris marina MBIC11017]|uniref:Uncharacterized protein n=1 Tax=Acaryochloris marina (strain MBIC 11017) TaxID=329726 RepID=B0CDX2_ACAM1|nr:hypothetical protein AM1_4345 [Acaryochloris marina MBIC11017]
MTLWLSTWTSKRWAFEKFFGIPGTKAEIFLGARAKGTNLY